MMLKKLLINNINYMYRKYEYVEYVSIIVVLNVCWYQ